MARLILFAVALLAGIVSPEAAQVSRPAAEVATFVSSSGAHVGSRIDLALAVTLPEGIHVQSDAPRDPALIPTALIVELPPGLRLEEIVYPPATDFHQAGQSQPLAVFEREFTIGVRVAVSVSRPPGDVVIPVRLRYQACDAQMCYAPATVDSSWEVRIVPAAASATAQHPEVFDGIAFGTGRAPDPPRDSRSEAHVDAPDAGGGLSVLDRFTVVASTGGYRGRDEFLQFIRDAESGAPQKGAFDGKGPWAILLLTFLGGLALNLTPCVLPMIPINLAIIGAGAQAGSRARGLLLGSVYGGAMALAYGALGLLVILAAGAFGAINASPWFNAAIAVIFAGLALAMFDLVSIDFSRVSSRFAIGSRSRGSLALAFTMGAVTALLAGACVAPVVIQVILHAGVLYAGGTGAALALPFVLGIGMALPWPIVGAGLASLPKPGRWMVRVKQAFGVLILVMAVYYGYLAYSLFASRWVDPSAVAASAQAKLEAGWYASLEPGLAAAERDGKPVLIDLWATWCKTCLTMDVTTLSDPAVVAALSDYVKIKVQAEDPNREPARSVMARFGAVGLPTYAILRPKVGETAATSAAQSRTLVPSVRAAITEGDFSRGEELVAAHRAANGVTPEMLQALSWLGRGALAARHFDRANGYASEAYELARAEGARRGVDSDRGLATALGAAIEVLAHVGAERESRTEAVTFLRGELERYGTTSLQKRIQKNIHLLSLEGTPAPILDVTEHLGPQPPTLASLKGKVILLFFWAHWCGDCKAQGPALARLIERYGDQGLTLLAPTQRYGYVAGGATATPDEERRYIGEVINASYSWLGGHQVPLGGNNHQRYGVSTTPTLVLVDREGLIRQYHPGRMTDEALEALVKRLVGES